MIEFEVPDTVLNTQCNDPPLEVHLGICLPESCSRAEKEAIISSWYHFCNIYRCSVLDVSQHPMHVHCEPSSHWHVGEVIFL